MANALSQIEHIVVVMFENRSFDNMLGYLYPPSRADFEGVAKAELPNLWNGRQFWPQHGTDMVQPLPDPNEEYQFVYRQIYNDFASSWPPAAPTLPPTMQGFVADYRTAKNVTDRQAPVIMKCFQPADVPVLSGLAAGYAVCDHWFASIPTQTLCNRSYVHAGTSSGYVNNSWKRPGHLLPGFFINDTTTIYNLLEQAKISWRVYAGGGFWLSNTWLTQAQLLQFTKLTTSSNNHFFDMAQFYSDVQREETFPAYAFIEPNYITWGTNPETDEHPEAGLIDLPGSPSNVLFGEQFLFEIFTALTKSPAWGSTLLVVVFDEHGGTYDHLPPATPTVSPDGVVVPVRSPGGSGFGFDRYGVRVPAVLVSPLIDSGTISNTIYDHTSVLRTAINCFGLTTGGKPATLLARESAANDLSEVINRTRPRSDIPKITPRAVPSLTGEQTAAYASVPLNELQKSMLHLATQHAARLSTLGEAAAQPPETVQTHADGWRVLARLHAAEGTIRG